MASDTKKASLEQEKSVAADNNGRLNPGSGNGWRHKNDVRSATTSFECKTTTKLRYSLKLAELETAETYATADSKDMAFVTDIAGRRYYTVTAFVWETMTDGWPSTDFMFFYSGTTGKSAPLDREKMDPQETEALSGTNDPVWVTEIQGKSYVTVRDYTWHMLRGD